MGFISRKIAFNPAIVPSLVFLIALIIIGILFYRQIIIGPEPVEESVVRNDKVFKRGEIYFTDKGDARFLAAITYEGNNLILSPRELGDVEETYEHLNTILPLDRDAFFAKAAKTNSQYEILARRLDDTVVDKVRERINRFGLKGIHLEPEAWRKYPFNTTGSHVVGFVAFNDENEFRGQYGLERHYDIELTRSPDIAKGTVNILKELFRGDEASRDFGNVVFSTIDLNMQQVLERELATNRKRWGAEKIGGIILDPRDGKVIALAVAPSFNLNNRPNNVSLFNNPIVESRYEMGSVFKVLTLAIAIDSGKVTKDFTYNDTGSITSDQETIYNYDGKGRGRDVGIQKIISQSLNTAQLLFC